MSGLVAIGDVDGVRGFVSLGIDLTPLGVASLRSLPAALAVFAYGHFEVVGVGWSVEVGGHLRFVSTPSSERCLDRKCLRGCQVPQEDSTP